MSKPIDLYGIRLDDRKSTLNLVLLFRLRANVDLKPLFRDHQTNSGKVYCDVNNTVRKNLNQ